MVTMYDSTEPRSIPADAQAVAGYVGGRWPTYPEMIRRFPHALHLSIAVNSTEDADCLDIETGDATPAKAPAWFRRQKARGSGLIVFYANLSTMPAVVAAMNAAGIHRSEYLLWVAYYDNIANVPGSFDAKQYFDKALGRNLDVSLCDEDFFGHTQTPAYEPADEKRWEREFNELVSKKGAWANLRRRVLKRTMVHRERQIVSLAELSGGWSIRNRRDRYRKLFACTGAR